MNRLRPITHPIETARAAPLGSALIGANFIPVIVGVVESINRSEVTELISTFPINAFGIAMSSLLVIRQLRLRERVEESIEDIGFEPRVMSLTTDEWCARQTVRTTLRGTEHLDAYEALCAERESTAQLKWLPHI